MSEPVRKSSTFPVALSLGVLLAMGTLTAYAPTLYDLFCRVTGFGGTTQRAVEAPSAATSERTITVRFDANTANGLPWAFRPKVREVTLKLGEVRDVAYVARSEVGDDSWGRATFNVSPPAAGAYFNKIACFCFTNQHLAPGQSVDMPVQFFVDPEIVDDELLAHLPDITLSYTFFPDEKPEEVAQAPTGAAASGAAPLN